MLNFIGNIIKKFLDSKRYLYFLPKFLRLKIFNIRRLKLYNTKTGKYYLPQYAYKDIIRDSIINDIIFDDHIYRIAKEYIKPNSTVLDLGSNFGQLGILFSKTEQNVDVYCYEASKYIFDILKKNIEINQVSAKAFNYIISDQSGIKMKIKTATLKDYNTYGSNKVEIANDDFDNNFEEVEVKKIDDFTFDKKISFMKIDIQGYDLMALKGSIKTILKHKMPIIFEYTPEFSEELKYTFADFENFINKINYYVVKKIDYYNYLILPK